MSIQSDNVRKPAPNAQADRSHLPRKRRIRVNIEHEDDDWMPQSPTLSPTRVASEFFENDYDVM